MKLVASNGMEFYLNKPQMIVGRDATNDVVLPDQRVSRQHATLQQSGATFAVSDMGSTNGTFVNGMRIVNANNLQIGDVVSFGGLELIVQADESSQTMPASRTMVAPAQASPRHPAGYPMPPIVIMPMQQGAQPQAGVQLADERVLREGALPFAAFYFNHGCLWYLLFGWNLGLLTSWLASMSWALRITTQRVALTAGLISQSQRQLEYFRVKDIRYSQGIIHRIAGIGEVRLISDDASMPSIAFCIENPQTWSEQIRVHVREQRIEMRAMHVS